MRTLAIAFASGLAIGALVVLIVDRLADQRSLVVRDVVAFERPQPSAFPPDGWEKDACSDGFKIAVGVTNKVTNEVALVSQIEQSVNDALMPVKQRVSLVPVPVEDEVIGDPCGVASDLKGGLWSAVTSVADADLFAMLMTVINTNLRGCALVIGATSTERHFAVDVSAAVGRYFTFAHEIGHLAGGGHDPGVPPTAAISAAYGYYDLSARPPFRTIMSEYCIAGGACPDRLNAFSNPAARVGGRPIGSSNSDMVSALATAIPYLASLSCP